MTYNIDLQLSRLNSHNTFFLFYNFLTNSHDFLLLSDNFIQNDMVIKLHKYKFLQSTKTKEKNKKKTCSYLFRPFLEKAIKMMEESEMKEMTDIPFTSHYIQFSNCFDFNRNYVSLANFKRVNWK